MAPFDGLTAASIRAGNGQHARRRQSRRRGAFGARHPTQASPCHALRVGVVLCAGCQLAGRRRQQHGVVAARCLSPLESSARHRALRMGGFRDPAPAAAPGGRPGGAAPARAAGALGSRARAGRARGRRGTVGSTGVGHGHDAAGASHHEPPAPYLRRWHSLLRKVEPRRGTRDLQGGVPGGREASGRCLRVSGRCSLSSRC